jgi:stress response protein YsnF
MENAGTIFLCIGQMVTQTPAAGDASMVQKAGPLPNAVSGDSSITLPVHEEALRAGIRHVDTGKGVRVHKSITEHLAQIDETLLHEDVELKHIPVDAIYPMGEAPGSRYEGDTFIVPILEEILVVEKRIRVKEELHIIKRKRTERHSESVLLKSEEVSVEHFDEGSETSRKQI